MTYKKRPRKLGDFKPGEERTDRTYYCCHAMTEWVVGVEKTEPYFSQRGTVVG